MHKPWWDILPALYHLFHGFLPYLLGGGGVAGGQTLWQKFRQRRAAAWPSADGEIQSAQIQHRNGYSVQIGYRYYARSAYHYGKYSRRFRRRQQAEQFADSIRGRCIQVRFQEDKPEISTILDHDLHLTGALEIG